MKQSGSSHAGQTDRQPYLDYIRVVSIIAVIGAHVCAQNWYAVEVTGFAWNIFNIYDSCLSWSVGTFVMISGALFLDREIPIKKLYSKYIFRLVCSFLIWSMIYSFFTVGGIEQKVETFLKGYYHMWFILMMIGLYMCMPFIRNIVFSRWRAYYILLSVLFASVIPELLETMKQFGNQTIVSASNILTYNYNKMQIPFVLGYGGYFVIGYCIHKYEMSKKQRLIVYILGVVGVLSAILLNALVSFRTHEPYGNFFGPLTVNMLFAAMAVFTFLKYRTYRNSWCNLIVQRMARYSFGVYLVHVLILERIGDYTGIYTLSFNPCFSVILITGLVALISFLISALLHRVPIVNRFIV